jgi:LytS/YehU family sensor histidine kinase
MIPFVENSFKHGTSQMLQDSWIVLDIYVGKENLLFKIKNSKPNQPTAKAGKNGIGLMNVKKRLELLYPGRHVLNIESNEESFSVFMKVPLEKMDHAFDEELSEHQLAPAKLSYVEH